MARHAIKSGMGWRRCFTGACALACLFAGLGILRNSALAQAPDDEEDDAATPWYEGTASIEEAARESWGGAEAFRRVWSLYTGSTYAPFGNLRQDGLRVRAVSSTSGYTYTGRRFDPSVGAAVWQTFRGQARTVDMLAGYQWRSGDLTVKVFAGYQNTAIVIAPYDPETLVQGQKHGAKGALELWYNITPRHWVALDMTAATAFRSYSHRLRIADRPFEHVSLGLEGAAFGHMEGTTVRAGAFVRYDDGRHEVSVAAGWSMPRGDAGHAYGSVQWLYRY